MSDRELTTLLDRAAAHTPPMDVPMQSVLAAGGRRVRHRRATAGALGVGGLALVGALWLGGPGGGAPTGTPDLSPAGPVWEQDEPVDGVLFTGETTYDQGQVEHDYRAELARPVPGGPVFLELSDRGRPVESVPAQTVQPGLEVFAGERMTVAVWREPEGTFTSFPLVGAHDPGGASGARYAEVDGETLAWTSWVDDVHPRPEQVLDVYLVGAEEVVALSGEPVGTEVLRADGQRVVAFVDEARGVWGYALDDDRPGRQVSGLHQLGGTPAMTAAHRYVDEEGGGLLAVLPEGAHEVEVPGPGTADPQGGVVDAVTVTLAGRPVVLAATGPAPGTEDTGAVQVTFTLGGVGTDLDLHAQDLFTLEGAAGPMSVAPDPADPGTLVLTSQEDGQEVARVAAEQLGRGLATTTVDGSVVVLSAGWEPGATVLSDARVQVTGEDGPEWVRPRDVAQLVLDDGTLVTALAVDGTDTEVVVAVGRQVGDRVEVWELPALVSSGVELRRDPDGQLVPFVGGDPLPRVDDGDLGEVRHHAGPGSEAGLLVVPGVGPGRTAVPLVRGDQDRLVADPGAVRQVDRLEIEDAAGGGVRSEAVLWLDASLVEAGGSLVEGLAVADAEADEAANSWSLLGSTRSASVAFEPSAVATVSPDLGLWLLYPLGSVDPALLQVGRVGESLLQLAGDDPDAVTLAAVLPVGSTARLVGPDVEGGVGASAVTDLGEGVPLQLAVWTVQVPGGGTLTDRGAGLDTDGDGTVDVPLTPPSAA